MTDRRKKILVICDYFLPGFKSGGGMWTVVNLVQRFHTRFDFYIVTRNHDGPSDRTPYRNVTADEWNTNFDAKVFYLSSQNANHRKLSEILRNVQPDLVFINSVFSSLGIRFLLARRRSMLSAVPVIIAPTGELSAGALSLKKVKKHAFLFFARLIGLYRKVIWKASFELESQEIERVFSNPERILIAPDLAPKEILPDFEVSQKPRKVSGEVRMIFASRINRKKNLLFFIERLAEIHEGNVALEIAGPIEDSMYWEQCTNAISRLPSNIKVKFLGAVSNNEVLEHLCNNHFFVLPTLNENFGYVFLEALAAGSLVVTSTGVPWKELESYQIGWSTDLENHDLWRKRLAECIAMTGDEFSQRSIAAREFAEKWINDASVEKATLDVLQTALASRV